MPIPLDRQLRGERVPAGLLGEGGQGTGALARRGSWQPMQTATLFRCSFISTTVSPGSRFTADGPFSLWSDFDFRRYRTYNTVGMPKPTFKEEKALWAKGHAHVAGTDEAGKGAWAGPIVAAAVVIAPTFKVRGVNDSKQLTKSQREKLFVRVTRHAVSWAVAVISSATIDRIGIQKANVRAIETALKKLHVRPDAVLVDAVKVKHGRQPVKAIIRGDAKVMSIAAASIVAKVVRDALMDGLDREIPGYNFRKHKGYGTAEHHAKLKILGLSPAHRRSFEPMKTYARKKGRR